jgi:methyl-accepting chemotaxis protein
MMKQSTGRIASALVVGATALLLCVPIASADDPPPCDQNEQNAQNNDPQCQDQKGAGIANQAIDDAKQGADQAKQAADQAKQAADQAKEAADQAKQGVDQAKQAADQAKQGAGQGQKPIDLADKNCWLVDGVPTMWTPALHTSPGQTAVPCYSVYGLQPH